MSSRMGDALLPSQRRALDKNVVSILERASLRSPVIDNTRRARRGADEAFVNRKKQFCFYNDCASLQRAGVLMIRHRLIALTLFTGILFAVPAAAQEVGVRAGVSADPDQFYFGGHFETPALVDKLHFRPNVEIGVGDHVTLVAFNIEFAYHIPTGPNWYTYVGGGPALNFIRFQGDTNSEGGFNLLVGVQHTSGLFAELKGGLADSPNLKVGVGYAIRLR